MRHSLIPVLMLAVGCTTAAARQSTAVTPQTGSTPVSVVPTRTARAELTHVLDSIVSDAQWKPAFWGILIVDPATGDTLYSHNASKLFLPASNQKILTGSTAIARLGPDYRFRTTYAMRGTRAGSTLRGDLIVVGRGDPSVSDTLRNGNALNAFDEVADSLRAHGISRITGKLVHGGDALPGSIYGYGWEVDELDASYAAPVDELFFNEGFTRLIVQAGAPGSRPSVQNFPSATYPVLRVQATVVPAMRVPLPQGTRRPRLDVSTDSIGVVILTGQIEAGRTDTIDVALRNPAEAYLSGLKEVLERKGISVGGIAAQSDTLPGADTLFSVLSLPLRTILPVFLKPSQNQIGELLLRTLGREVTGVGTADSGRRVIERQIRTWGADSTGAAVRDGSGLSRHDYLSPETIVRVYSGMLRDPNFRIFYDALPIAGVDGTIRTRMRGTVAAGNVHAKTGTIDRARSLSGYVTTADGRMLIFSVLCNAFTTPVSAVNRVQDEIAIRLASLPGAPVSTTSGTR